MILFDGALIDRRFFDQPFHFCQRARRSARIDHPVARHFLDRQFKHADQVAADLVIGVDHLFHAAGRADHQLVGQQDRERLVADDCARAPDRVAEPERDLLAHGDDVARRARVASSTDMSLAALAHRGFELERDVEVLDDRGLAAAGDEDHLLDPRLARLVDRVLDQRPVDDRQHLLGNRLGRGEEAG